MRLQRPSLHLTASSHLLDILPSGLLTPNAHNLVGSGCVIHIPGLLKELGDLEAKGLPNVRERLFISDRAQYVYHRLSKAGGGDIAGTETNSCSVVLDLHQKLDGIEEAELGGQKLGTTGKGIGPCYSTKASRSGIRMADIFQQDLFEDRVRKLA